MSQFQIREDDLKGKEIADFLQGYLDDMNEITLPKAFMPLI